MKILVTGGAGYIGSHTCVELLAAGHDLVVVDNFSNSKPEALEAIRTIAGRDFAFIQSDVRDRTAMEDAFSGASGGRGHPLCGPESGRRIGGKAPGVL